MKYFVNVDEKHFHMVSEKGGCRNPSLGLVTKAKACKGVG
jgi:hypothetical protein